MPREFGTKEKQTGASASLVSKTLSPAPLHFDKDYLVAPPGSKNGPEVTF